MVKRIIKYIIIKTKRLIMKTRVKRYRFLCRELGENVVLLEGIRFNYPERLCIGDNVAINNDVWINAAGGVEIGNYVIIGPKVVMHSANHKFNRLDIPIQKQGHIMAPVVIEDDVWIGAAAIILPGVRVGKGSVIAAGAVVTKDIPPYSIAMGVPAVVKGSRRQADEKHEAQTKAHHVN